MIGMIDDTIVAIATAPGEAGIGIVRISGNKSLDILEKVFVPKRKKEIREIPNRTVNYGNIVDESGKIVDEVLVMIMREPYSYTKEDVVEIHCHGGIVPVRKIMELVLKYGARLAEPGEFTKRAFLNGRIDLAQAEAVIDVITSKTESGLSAALNQLQGGLSEEVRKIMNILLSMLAHIEASIDFPEHDIEEITENTLKNNACEVKEYIMKLIDTFEEGKIVRDGLKTAIVGRPNVGKSSLLNVLLKENRAIVTDIPGTTRDVIEEYLNIRGILIKLIDTAGIRETEDIVEKIGVERTTQAMKEADLIILVFDISKPLTDEDRDIIEMVKEKKVLAVGNKIDIGINGDINFIIERFGSENVIKMSVANRIGIEELEDKIKNMVYHGAVSAKSSTMVSSIRHKRLLENALYSIERCIESIDEGIPVDLLSVDIKEAWNNLGQITGDTVEEDIVNEIFSKFCVGK